MTAPTTGEPLVYGSVTVSAPSDGGPAASVTREVTAPDSPPAQTGDTAPSPVPAANTADTITIQTPGSLQQGTAIGPTAQAGAGPDQTLLSASQSAYFSQVFNDYAQLFTGNGTAGTGPATNANPSFGAQA